MTNKAWNRERTGTEATILIREDAVRVNNTNRQKKQTQEYLKDQYKIYFFKHSL